MKVLKSIMKYAITVLVITFLCTTAYPQTQEKIKHFPAAWLWKITTDRREMYLFGEIHKLLVDKQKTVDFSIAESVYEGVSEIYLELANENKLSDSCASTIKLVDLLEPAVWKELQSTYRKVLWETDISEEGKKATYKVNMYVMANCHPSIAFTHLGVFLPILQSMSIKNDQSYYEYKEVKEGLLLTTAKNQKYKEKIQYIENGQAIQKAWDNECGPDKYNITNQYIKQVIEAAQHDFEIDYAFLQWYEDWENPQSLANISNSDLHENNLWNKCTVFSRTDLWMPKINEILSTTGNPVAMDVGLAHVLGPRGSLEQLKTRGDVKIEQIFQAPPEFLNTKQPNDVQ